MTDDPNSEPSSLPLSAGALLREAREKQGLHIAALAASIKVAPRKLDALENDRWSELPDATFTRALAQTVCRTLKIDAKPVLDLLPAQGGSTFDRRGAALNEPFRERMERGDPAAAGTAIRPMVWAAAGLMVAALALYFFPRGTGTNASTNASTGPGAGTGAAQSAVAASAPAGPGLAASAAALAASAAEIAAPPVALAATAPGAADTLAATAAALAAAPQLTPLAATPVAEPVVANKSAGASGAPAAAAADTAAAALTLSASRASWVDVRDARGQVLISRTLSSGETVGLEGLAPLRVAIGNAAAVQLVFRGQPFDVASRTRENVARFELP